MNKKLYNKALKNPKVRDRYLDYKYNHPNVHKYLRPFSWAYLAALQVKYLFPSNEHLTYPESKSTKQYSVEEILTKAESFDIVSFDIFDTLLFRAVKHPFDVFIIIGSKLNIVDFTRLRIWAEIDARTKASREKPLNEVNIYEIYDQLRLVEKEKRPSILELEFETEKQICFANAHLKKVFDDLKASGKKIIATSDMYWPKEQMVKLLKHHGFEGFDDVFVSCDYCANKGTGTLQKLISEKYKDKRILHIGDEITSDCLITRGIKNWDSLHYKNVNLEGEKYRRKSESISTSICNALINSKLHSGVEGMSKPFEFGYAYGGFLSYGYCQHIDNFIDERDRKGSLILFTARDCETFHNIYKKHFNNVDSEYFYCSREALLKACFPFAIDIFFETMFIAKIQLKKKQQVVKTLEKLDLSFLVDYFDKYDLSKEDVIDWVSVYKIEALIFEHRAEISKHYEPIRKACLGYLNKYIKSKKNIIVVDLGWRGTVFYLLKHLILEIYPSMKVSGCELGSTPYSPIPVTLIENKELNSYIFSHFKNTDLQIKGKHVMIAETLFTSTDPSTKGYERVGDVDRPVFGEPENKDSEIFNEFKKGMYCFAEDYDRVVRALKYSPLIGGRDAYLPLHKIYKKYDYIMDIFSSLKSRDMVAADSEDIKALLKRFGYTKKTA